MQPNNHPTTEQTQNTSTSGKPRSPNLDNENFQTHTYVGPRSAFVFRIPRSCSAFGQAVRYTAQAYSMPELFNLTERRQWKSSASEPETDCGFI